MNSKAKMVFLKKYLILLNRCVYECFFETLIQGYIPIAAEKAHARIIWDCGWAIGGDVFATASRDKTVFDSCCSPFHISCLGVTQVKIWNKNNGKWKAVVTLTTKQPATAVAFTSLKENNRFCSRLS